MNTSLCEDLRVALERLFKALDNVPAHWALDLQMAIGYIQALMAAVCHDQDT